MDKSLLRTESYGRSIVRHAKTIELAERIIEVRLIEQTYGKSIGKLLPRARFARPEGIIQYFKQKDRERGTASISVERLTKAFLTVANTKLGGEIEECEELKLLWDELELGKNKGGVN